jgi:hypothetical protein
LFFGLEKCFWSLLILKCQLFIRFCLFSALSRA